MASRGSGKSGSLKGILYCDLVGSRGFAQARRDRVEPWFDQFQSILGALVYGHEGTMVWTGDGCIALFPRVADAFSVALASERELSDLLSDWLMLRLRRGVHVGDVPEIPQSLGGVPGWSDSLSVAKEIMAAASEGHVLASEAACHAAGRGQGLRFRSWGELDVKTWEEAIRVYEVLSDEGAYSEATRRWLSAVAEFRTSRQSIERGLQDLTSKLLEIALDIVGGTCGSLMLVDRDSFWRLVRRDPCIGDWRESQEKERANVLDIVAVWPPEQWENPPRLAEEAVANDTSPKRQQLVLAAGHGMTGRVAVTGELERTDSIEGDVEAGRLVRCSEGEPFDGCPAAANCTGDDKCHENPWEHALTETTREGLIEAWGEHVRTGTLPEDFPPRCYFSLKFPKHVRSEIAAPICMSVAPDEARIADSAAVGPRGDVLGVINVDGHFVGQYGPQDAQLLSTFGELAAKTISDALLARAQEAVEAVFRLTDRFGIVGDEDGPDPSELLRSAVSTMAAGLNAAAVEVLWWEERANVLRLAATSARRDDRSVPVYTSGDDTHLTWQVFREKRSIRLRCSYRARVRTIMHCEKISLDEVYAKHAEELRGRNTGPATSERGKREPFLGVPIPGRPGEIRGVIRASRENHPMDHHYRLFTPVEQLAVERVAALLGRRIPTGYGPPTTPLTI